MGAPGANAGRGCVYVFTPQASATHFLSSVNGICNYDVSEIEAPPGAHGFGETLSVC